MSFVDRIIGIFVNQDKKERCVSDYSKKNVVLKTSTTGLWERRFIAPTGFEPMSRDPESPMIDHYTTGLFCNLNVVCYHIRFSLIADIMSILLPIRQCIKHLC